jgi:acetoin utilization deacetylase AcuC-like enzyme
MHGAKNYPLFKVHSSLDVELEDNTSDEAYLKALTQNLSRVLEHKADLVFYLAGADPFSGDKLGRLAVSIEGLRERDEYVLQTCQHHELPLVTVMSGGYGEDINDTVEIHCNTIRAARSIFEPELIFG